MNGGSEGRDQTSASPPSAGGMERRGEAESSEIKTPTASLLGKLQTIYGARRTKMCTPYSLVNIRNFGFVASL